MGTDSNRLRRWLRLVFALSVVWNSAFGGWFATPKGSIPVATAAGATTYLQNGSFEDALNNWTAMNYRIDLGATNIGGCVSVDTTNYGAYANVSNDHADTGTFTGFTTQNVTTANSLAPVHGTYAVRMDLGSGVGVHGLPRGARAGDRQRCVQRHRQSGGDIELVLGSRLRQLCGVGVPAGHRR